MNHPRNKTVSYSLRIHVWKFTQSTELSPFVFTHRRSNRTKPCTLRTFRKTCYKLTSVIKHARVGSSYRTVSFQFTAALRDRIRGRTAGKLPGAPNYKERWRRHWNNQKYDDSKLGFPHVKEFLLKLVEFRHAPAKFFQAENFKEYQFEGAPNY
jgi:hypothetical protein